MSGGSAVSFEKVVGLLIFASWIAHRATRPPDNVRAIASRHPGMIVAIVFFVGWSLLSAAWAANAGTAAVTAYRDSSTSSSSPSSTRRSRTVMT